MRRSKSSSGVGARHALWLILGLACATGCAPKFEHYRERGTRLLAQQRYAAARGPLEAAHEMVPEHADNLCDLAGCHIGLARDYLARDDQRAAGREIDKAINYYNRAIKSYPGYARALNGKNAALELRGSYNEALATAEWASRVVGPSARQQLFLARELAERGDADRALLAFRQAVAMEPDNPAAHWAIGTFYLDLGRRDEGIQHLQQAYRLDPGQAYVASELRRLGAEVPDMNEDLDALLDEEADPWMDEEAAAVSESALEPGSHAATDDAAQDDPDSAGGGAP